MAFLILVAVSDCRHANDTELQTRCNRITANATELLLDIGVGQVQRFAAEEIAVAVVEANGQRLSVLDLHHREAAASSAIKMIIDEAKRRWKSRSENMQNRTQHTEASCKASPWASGT